MVLLPTCAGRPFDHRDVRETQRSVRLADCLQRILVPRTRHRCFYRSYARTVVLRKLGVPAVLNFGLRNLGAQATAPTAGHCWVTVDDSPFMEQDSGATYPVLLAQTPEGIRYWVGRDDPPSARKVRR